jgi:F0F1-type ATP synthase membrane subunit a
MFQIKFSKIIFSVLVFALTMNVFAQASRKSTKKKPVKKAASTQMPTVVEDKTNDTIIKKKRASGSYK